MAKILTLDVTSFKFADNETDLSFTALKNGMIISDSTLSATIKIKQADVGYLKSVSAKWVDKHIVISSGDLSDLPVGSYLLELWLSSPSGYEIYPDSGFVRLYINQNATGISGNLISSITLGEFQQQFSDLAKELKNQANKINDDLNNRGLNVKDFGAVGDGIADDTKAIQAALDAVPENGGIVYIPAGTYLVNQNKLRDGSTDTYGALFPKPNTTMIGDGASTIIQLADGTQKVDLIYAKNTPNLKFIDLTIDAGPRKKPYFTTGFQLNTVDNLVIRDVTVTRGNIEGMYLYNSTNFDINGLHTHDNGAWQDDASGLHLDSCHNGVVSNIISHNNGFHGVIISTSSEIVINNITAHHNGWQGLHIQTGSNQIQVTNGSFTNNCRGIYIRDWGTDNNLLRNIVVASNTYDGVLTWVAYNNIINGMQAINNGEHGVKTGVKDDTIYIYASIFKNNNLGDTYEVDGSHIYINGLEKT